MEYERYELIASVKVGFDNDQIDNFISDLVLLLAHHNILCVTDHFKAALVGDHLEVICQYGHGKVS